MVPNANAKHFRLKAAQRDLIAAAGGIERAAEICSFGKSTVGRWSKIDSPEIMPPDAVDKLENETGLTVWTAAWLSARGLKLADDEAKPNGDCLAAAMSGLSGEFGALLAEWAAISADGHATPAEADSLLRRHLPAMKSAIEQAEDASAQVIASGGSALFKPRVVAGGK